MLMQSNKSQLKRRSKLLYLIILLWHGLRKYDDENVAVVEVNHFHWRCRFLLDKSKLLDETCYLSQYFPDF